MKSIFSLIIISLLVNLSVAQDVILPADENNKVYVSFKGGFTFPVAQSTIGSPRDEVGESILIIRKDGNEESFSEKSPFGSRGAGGTAAASVGYMIHENFGVEMEFSFIRTVEINDASKDIDTSGARYFAEQTSHTNMFRVAPTFVVMGNEDLKVRPYAKLGILVPIAGATVATLNFNDETGVLADQLLPVLDEGLYNDIQAAVDSVLGTSIPIPTEATIAAKTYGQFSVGFTAKAGADFQINNKLSIFGEVEVNMLTIKSKQSKITDFYAGVTDENLVLLAENLLGKEIKSEFYTEDIPEILRLTNYEDEITETTNSSYDVNSDTYDRNSPYQQLDFRDNYNSFGIMVGLKYRF